MPVAIYIRKSSESEDRQVQSLEDQKKVLLEYAKRNRITISEVFEESRSAKQPGYRPVFNELMRKVEMDEITGLLVWHMNRLSRNMLEGGQIAHLLHSGKLEFIRTPERTYFPDDSALLISIENGMATSFIQDLRRNTIRGMIGKAERGWMPTRPPLGYLYNKLTHEIEIDPVRFPILQHCWKQLATGSFTLADVMRQAKELGLVSSLKTMKLHKSAFCALFRNPFYFGEFEFRGKTYQGRHIAMVSKDEFEIVQQVLNGRLRANGSKHRNKFSGLMVCGTCGCSITGETKVKTYPKTGRTVSYTYYHCTGAKGCRKVGVSQPKLQEFLEFEADFVRMPVEVLAWLAAELSKYVGFVSEVESASDQLKEDQSAKLQQRLKRLNKMRLDEEISANEYREMKAEIEKEIGEITKTVTEKAAEFDGLAKRIYRKLSVLEQVSGRDWLEAETAKGFLKQLGQNYFLTLEKLVVEYDPIVRAICAFEPLRNGSYNDYWPGFNLQSSVWHPLMDEIRTSLMEDRDLLPSTLT